jgi:hypothetical protein
MSNSYKSYICKTCGDVYTVTFDELGSEDGISGCGGDHRKHEMSKISKEDLDKIMKGAIQKAYENYYKKRTEYCLNLTQ